MQCLFVVNFKNYLMMENYLLKKKKKFMSFLHTDRGDIFKNNDVKPILVS